MQYLLGILIILVINATCIAKEENDFFTIRGATYKPEYDNLEVLGVFLHEDKSFVSEGGVKTSKDIFLRTIELARKHPPQFLVQLILFPELQSNNDLRLIRQWCMFFDSHNIPWVISVWPDGSKAPKFLYVNPPEDAPDTLF